MTRATSTIKSKDLIFRKKQRKAGRFLKRAGTLLKHRRPNLNRVAVLQKKASKLLSEITDQELRHQTKKHEKARDNTISSKAQDPSLSFSLEKISDRQIKSYGAYSCAYKGKLNDINSNSNTLIEDSISAVENVFSNVISQVKSNCNLNNPERDGMRLMVSANNLIKPLSTRLVQVSEQNPSLILNEIGKVLQSEEELPLDESFTITNGCHDVRNSVFIRL